MGMYQQPLYQHLLSSDYPQSTSLSTTSPLLTGCIGVPKQEELTKSNGDTNKSVQYHTIYPQPKATEEESRPQLFSQSPAAKMYDPHPLHHQKDTIQNPSSSFISVSTTTDDFGSFPDQSNVAARYFNHPSQQIQHVPQPFPWPESVNQIYGWCKIAKKSKDLKSRVKLCRRFLATLAHYEANLNHEQIKSNPHHPPSSHSGKHAPVPPRSLESSLLSLPSLSSTSTTTSTSSSSSSSLSPSSTPIQAPKTSAEPDHIRHVMMRECLRILKRQSIGQGIGKGGDSEAQFILANCYGVGLLGLTEDHSKAFQWYMQASKQAHPEATYRTAVCYELGIGTRKDGQRALVFYRKSAHLSHAGSMYKLGVILLRGYYHTTPLPREAISWLQRAVSHVTTSSSPMSNITNITAPSQNQSTSLPTTTSSSLFSSPSSSSLSSLYFPNIKRSSRSTIASTTSQVYHHQAPHALHALAMIQMGGEVADTTSLIADPTYAIELLHQAAKRDHVPSQLQLGHCFEHGEWVPIDEAMSIYWYARAAQLESPEACLAISCWYLTGTTNTSVLLPSDREAYLWARRAIALSAVAAHSTNQDTITKAHFAVAMFLERGMNLDNCPPGKESIKTARSWMLKAAALGHQGASQWLMAKNEAGQGDAESTLEEESRQHQVNRDVKIDKGEEERDSKCIIM